MNKKLRYDLHYIRKQSFSTDVKILAKTVGVVLTGKGAY
jgi:lipopolysaccharide/colanic/teichoic acid biosynthesis glycosyltransferase